MSSKEARAYVYRTLGYTDPGTAKSAPNQNTERDAGGRSIFNLDIGHDGKVLDDLVDEIPGDIELPPIYSPFPDTIGIPALPPGGWPQLPPVVDDPATEPPSQDPEPVPDPDPETAPAPDPAPDPEVEPVSDTPPQAL
ncbi:hypothetical protein [Streptomyces sp. NPDC088725]|uniref:hypothetical protein n=1 Tax=Streptomyces sp. NPDC088725 TaxID=3365873 RepID=UPI00381C633F